MTDRSDESAMKRLEQVRRLLMATDSKQMMPQFQNTSGFMKLITPTFEESAGFPSRHNAASSQVKSHIRGEVDPVTLISINAFGGPALKMQGDSDRHNYLHPSMMVVIPSEKDLLTPPICLGEEP